jgi:hypothetical protein
MEPYMASLRNFPALRRLPLPGKRLPGGFTAATWESGSLETNNKKQARLESIRHVLSHFDYDRKGSSNTTVLPDPNVVQRYHRMITQID